MFDSLRTFKAASLFVLGYHWLPLATFDLVGDNREFEVWGIFWSVIPIIDGWWSQNFKGVSLFVLGYHWLPLATIDLVGDNREFEVLGIFWPVTCGGTRWHAVARGGGDPYLMIYTHYWWLIVSELQKCIIVCPWLPLVAPSNLWFSRW